ncbi:hypothetical protein TSOC_004328 [Tetrabaena socialis]|uniref:non-specific serine/threonine protein kinase n=1 Tax=Tetrabaena socialis TaxID=47790 RepID=A0A2J8A974_9CHLO|nr:hypothetical protein TSOC_004328 [Tetrabaena socialis]|eukprot:PNH09077.1 hypothetical protein TSOC_004328 [Tetrabaena socialis]
MQKLFGKKPKEKDGSLVGKMVMVGAFSVRVDALVGEGPVTLLEVMQRGAFNLDDFQVFEVFQEVAMAVAHMHQCKPPLAHRTDLGAKILRVRVGSRGGGVAKGGPGRPGGRSGATRKDEEGWEAPSLPPLLLVGGTNRPPDLVPNRLPNGPPNRLPNRQMWDLFARQRIDQAVDVWALGVLLYVLAFGKLPFQGDSKLSILYGKRSSFHPQHPHHPAAVGFGDDNVDWGGPAGFDEECPAWPPGPADHPHGAQQVELFSTVGSPPPTPPPSFIVPATNGATTSAVLGGAAVALASSAAAATNAASNAPPPVAALPPPPAAAAAPPPLGAAAAPPAVVRAPSPAPARAAPAVPAAPAAAALPSSGAASPWGPGSGPPALAVEASGGARSVAAAPPPPSPLSSAASGSGAVSSASALAAAAAVEGAAAGSSAPPWESLDAGGLRSELQRLAGHNTALEGRVQHLESLVASQGALLHKLAVELQNVQQQQQHHHHHQEQQQQQHYQQQWEAAGPRHPAVAGLAAFPSTAAATPEETGDEALLAEASAEGRGAGSSGPQPGLAAFNREAWAAEPGLERPPPVEAIYPPLRYEDLA